MAYSTPPGDVPRSRIQRVTSASAPRAPATKDASRSNPQADAATRREAKDALTKPKRSLTSTQVALGGACAGRQTAACDTPQPGQ